jgi:hypothetical protein
MRINETVVDARGWHYAVSGHNDFATIARWEGDWWALKWSGDMRHERITDVPPEVVERCKELAHAVR